MSWQPPKGKNYGAPSGTQDEPARWANESGGSAGALPVGHLSALENRHSRGADQGHAILKPGVKVGALGVAAHFGTYGRGRYAGATGEGERVGVKGVALDFDPMSPPLVGDHITGNRPGSGLGVHGVSGTGTGVRGDSRAGVGVIGKSRSVAGVEGQSEHDVGGVFVSATQAQLRLYPTLKSLPANGRAGDLLAVLGHDATLDVPTADLWFCVRAGHDRHQAVWKRMAFNATWPEEAQ